MKAWLIDALTMGTFFGVATGIALRDGIGEAVIDGVGFGVVMASLAAWRGWPSVGRR